MSCSTTSLSACTIKNTVTSEDPYAFTETAPTTPPTLFNNSQKSRNRLVVKQLNISPTVIVDKTQHLNKDSPSFVKVKCHGAKTQAPPSISIKNAALSTSAVLGVLNTNKIKYGPLSPKPLLESNQAKHTQHVLLAQNENATAISTLVATPAVPSVITSRNVQQQKPQTQQRNYLHHQQQQSQTPPPLLLSHTPSLWQTPLLLENPAAMESPTSTTTKNTTALVKDDASTTTTATTTTFVSSLKRTPIKISFQPPTPTLAATALITPIAIPAVTTGTATTGSIAPLHLIMPSAAPLPPSNFHNTTLAQHLQKVQCLKKSKKLNPSNASNIATQKPEATSKSTSKSTSKNTTQHSTTDLNEIPVNVIFRSPTKANNVDSNSQKDTPNAISNCDDKMKNRQMYTDNVKRLPIESNTEITISKKIVGIGSIQSPKQQSSKPSQKRKNFSTTCDGQQLLSHVSQPKQRKLQKSASTIKSVGKSELQKFEEINQQSKNIPSGFLPNAKPLKSGIDTFPVKPQKTSVKRKTNGTGQKTQKRNCKISFYPRTINEQEQSEYLMTEDLSSKTKAFAVIRMPYKEIEADISLLAEETVLPYCVQKHWFNINDRPIRSASIGREQRIIEYKNLLRRQAMQLLATRSLQQLPFHIARKRLLCVDALLRKYRDHNKTVVTGTIKRCEVENCINVPLEMTTYCRQHIMKNTKQCIFVQCSAKSLKDNQKSCDVPVLNIQKPYSVPLCFLHKAQHHHHSANAVKAVSILNQTTPCITTQTEPSKRVVAAKSTPCRKRKATTEMCTKNMSNMPNLPNLPNTNVMRTDTTHSLQRKNSTTSLESIGSNSHSSFASSIQPGIAMDSTGVGVVHKQPSLNNNTFQTNMLSPPSLAPLSYNSSGINNQNHNHINSNSSNLGSDFNNSSHRKNMIFGSGALDPTAEQEINKLVAQFAMAAAATTTPTNNNSSCNGSSNNINNNNNNNNSFNYMNTNSNSNLTSSGVGSSSSLPSTDELLTQDMLSICENSSAYASSSEDTGLGELSENELIGANGGVVVGCGSGFNDDDVSPDEIPLGDTRLLEENDLVNVFGTLPVNLNELFTTVVRQDEREEVERALEIADKHLKTLQETIGSDSDFLADFLDVNDDMLADTDDICSKMEIVSSVLSPPESLEAATLYLENTDSALNVNHHGVKNVTVSGNCVNTGNANNSGVMDIRGMLQT